MKRSHRGFMMVMGLLIGAPAAADPGRFALLIGNNRGAPGRSTLRFAESDARKARAVLTGPGRFPADQTILHLGQDAERVWRSLRALEARVIARQHRGSLLLIYYSGHASERALELGNTELPFGRLKQFIKRSKADVRVAVIDACQSGQLVASKGGTPGPAYRISLSNQMASKGYAIITSSALDELSQESQAIRGSTFTHHFISALRGAGDDSGDDKVTLTEAYRYAYSRTVAHTAANIGGGQHPMYDFKLSGRGDIVLTSPAAYRSGLLVVSPPRAKLLVLSKDRGSVVGEFAPKRGAPIRIALRPGSYWVYLVTDGGVREARAVVTANRFVQLSAGAFTSHTPRRSVDKGGLFARRPTHQIGGGFLLRRMPLDGSVLAYGAVVSYGLELPGGLQPRFIISLASAPDAGLSEGYYELGVHPGLRYTWLRFWRQRLALHAELRAGYEFISQKSRDQQSRYTSGFSYSGGVGLGFPLWGPLGGELGGSAGGRVLRLRQQGWEHRLDLQANVSLVWSWEAGR